MWGAQTPETLSTQESNRSEARAVVASPLWQATGNKPSNTEQTEQQYLKATQTATGAVATKPHKPIIFLSTMPVAMTQHPIWCPHAEPATQSAEQSTSTTKPHNAKQHATKH
jgi:hypothetical protein